MKNISNKNYLDPLPSRATRKVNMRSRASCRGHFNIKLAADNFRSRKVYFESKLERICAQLWLASGKVYDLREQIEPINFIDFDGRKRRHVFDFLITTIGGRRIAVVVKNSKTATKPKFRSTLNALRKHLPQSLADELLLFTNDSFHPTEAVNAERLLYLKPQLNAVAKAKLNEAIATMVGSIKIVDLIQRMNYVAGAFASILNAVFCGKLHRNHIGLIDLRTSVYAGGR